MSGEPVVRGHIEGLDGVRAVAVLAVLVFHLWPRHLPGGFLGVDVFFVLSGFLITTLLLRERQRNRFVDPVAFWSRRARRLLPALFTVVTVSIGAAWVVERDLLVGIGRQLLGALTFSSNWVELTAGTDYFDRTAPALFDTFWSLAVEEQFYLLWPVCFGAILALARTQRARARVAIGVAAASAGLMALLYSPGDPTAVYYGTHTHLFGLLLGAAVAFVADGDPDTMGGARWQAMRAWVGFPALAGLGVLAVTLDGDDVATFRGGMVLATVLAAVVIAALPGPASAFQRLHRTPVLEWIGERSYGIYLWHWPVILVVTAAFPAVAPGADPGLGVVVVSLAATFGLSAASYRWIELPVRQRGFSVALAPPRPRWAAAGAVAAVAVAGIGVATAPDKSAAQLAVERGLEQIDATSATATATPVVEAEVAGAGRSTRSTTSTTVPAPAPAWPVTQPEPTGDLMSGFGDSVLSGAAPAMYERFPGIHLDAVPIRQWKDAPAVVEAATAAGTLRPVVVLSFGTNAGLEDAESLNGLRTTLDLIGPHRRVVLVNVVGVSQWVPASNATLAEVSAEHPNVIVADWHSVVAADPGLLHNDRTHPDWDGIAVYADLVAQALVQLGPT